MSSGETRPRRVAGPKKSSSSKSSRKNQSAMDPGNIRNVRDVRVILRRSNIVNVNRHKASHGKSTSSVHDNGVSSRTRNRIANKHKSMMNLSNSMRESHSTSIESVSNETNLFDATVSFIDTPAPNINESLQISYDEGPASNGKNARMNNVSISEHAVSSDIFDFEFLFSQLFLWAESNFINFVHIRKQHRARMIPKMCKDTVIPSGNICKRFTINGNGMNGAKIKKFGHVTV